MRAAVTVDATPDQVWEVVGERFGDVAQWATPILTSRLVSESPQAGGAVGQVPEQVPAEGVARVCGIGGFGPFPAGEITERLTVFDRSVRRLEYRAVRGMPPMLRSAVNRWSVHPVPGAHDRCVVRVHATLRLRWWAAPFGPVMAWQLHRGARGVLQELRRWVEGGRPRSDGTDSRAVV